MKLSLNQRKYIYWAISIASVFVITLSIYQYLGGFDEIKVVESDNNIFSIAGKDFLGSYKSDTLRNIFSEMREHVNSERLNGDLCIINYRNEDLGDDQIHQFIGIKLGDEITEIPPGMDVRELKAEKTFLVGLGMHPFVMPSAEKTEGIISSYAQDQGYDVQNYSMEILFPDNSIAVFMFAK